MKTKLPEVPHTARSQIFRGEDRCLIAFVIVELDAPSRILALLPESNGFHTIHSAKIGKPDVIAHRVRSWRSGLSLRGLRSALAHLEEAVAEGCDSTIRLRLTPNEWHLVGIVCGRLNITPGQWFLGTAGYNASVADAYLDRILADLPSAP